MTGLESAVSLSTVSCSSPDSSSRSSWSWKLSVASSRTRDEPVAQHEIRRNGAEQIVVEVVVRQIDELQSVPFGEALRAGSLCRPFRRRRFRHPDVEIALAGYSR
jgi:hypothetical protein